MLHTDVLPGTEVMRDVEDTHFTRGDKSGIV